MPPITSYNAFKNAVSGNLMNNSSVDEYFARNQSSSLNNFIQKPYNPFGSNSQPFSSTLIKVQRQPSPPGLLSKKVQKAHTHNYTELKKPIPLDNDEFNPRESACFTHNELASIVLL